MSEVNLTPASAAEVDKNMIAGAPDAAGLVWYSAKEAPFEIYGLYEPAADGDFRRMPDDVAAATNNGVKRNARHTAGGRVRFSTNSRRVAIRVRMPYVTRYAHMPLTGSASFDLYTDTPTGSCFAAVFKPTVDITDGFELTHTFAKAQERFLTLNFPLYSPVSSLEIGLDAGSSLGAGKKYTGTRLPVVFYGSSITQGACASRPGLSYQSMISRRLDIDFINLGFSGNARAELPIVEYMAALPMSAFVSDYDHNAPNVDYLRETHCRMYRMIREKNPDIPYIMLSRPDYTTHSEADSSARRRVVEDTFRYAREQGDKSVWYIDGEGIFRGPEEDACTTDGSHPNDLGFMKMADSIGRILRRAMRRNI